MRYRDRDWLERMYHERGLTQREIAEECGVSPRCIRKWMTRLDFETRDVVGEDHGLHGTERSRSTKEKISKTLSGREVTEDHREKVAESNRGKTLSRAHRRAISESLHGITRSEETKRKMSESTAGESNPNWRGGISFRYGAGWAPARRAVFERDEVCRYCDHDGSERRLEVHHIVPVRRFVKANDADIEDAHHLSNLVLLCHRCHMQAEHGLLEFDSGIDDPARDENVG